jgi:hypothetical protein
MVIWFICALFLLARKYGIAALDIIEMSGFVLVILAIVLGVTIEWFALTSQAWLLNSIVAKRKVFWPVMIALAAVSALATAMALVPEPISATVEKAFPDTAVATSLDDLSEEELRRLSAPEKEKLKGLASQIVRFSVTSENSSPVTIRIRIRSEGATKPQTSRPAQEPIYGGDSPRCYVILGNEARVYDAETQDNGSVGGGKEGENYAVRIFGEPGTVHTVRIQVTDASGKTVYAEGEEFVVDLRPEG